MYHPPQDERATRIFVGEWGNMGTRQNQKSLTVQQQKAFVTAVIALKSKPSILHPGDASRGRYDDFVEVHLNAMMVMMNNQQSWGHQAAAFGPWHRVLLQQFELELQKIDPSVDIPYWDWTKADVGPLWSNDFLGGDGDAHAKAKVTTGRFAFDRGEWPIRVKDDAHDPDFLRRRLGKSGDDLPGDPDVDDAKGFGVYDLDPWEDSLRDPSAVGQWAAFRIALENNLHNTVHRWVGGNMGDMSSPNDPVFWLHHCNIDRLWGEWQRGSGHDYLPQTGGPTGHNLNDAMIFHDPGAPAPWPGTQTPASVLDYHALGIKYDTDPAVAPFDALAAARVERRRSKLPRFVVPKEIPALARLLGKR